MYILELITSAHSTSSVRLRLSSFSSAARSAMAVYMYMARTAWPTTLVCSRTGMCDWLYS